MDANKSELLHKELSFEIVGAAMRVLNELGHGLNEKLYENSLIVEFKHNKIAVDQQRRFEVLYREVVVGTYIPDLLVSGKIIVDTKVVEAIGNDEVGQMMNYLRIAKLDLGIILNFRYPKLQYRTIALSD